MTLPESEHLLCPAISLSLKTQSASGVVPQRYFAAATRLSAATSHRPITLSFRFKIGGPKKLKPYLW